MTTTGVDRQRYTDTPIRHPFSSWRLNQLNFKICSWNWIISPNFGVKIPKMFETCHPPSWQIPYDVKCYIPQTQLLQVVTWNDSPNGGHLYKPWKGHKNGSFHEVTLKNLVENGSSPQVGVTHHLVLEIPTSVISWNFNVACGPQGSKRELRRWRHDDEGWWTTSGSFTVCVCVCVLPRFAWDF